MPGESTTGCGAKRGIGRKARCISKGRDGSKSGGEQKLLGPIRQSTKEERIAQRRSSGDRQKVCLQYALECL